MAICNNGDEVTNATEIRGFITGLKWSAPRKDHQNICVHGKRMSVFNKWVAEFGLRISRMSPNCGPYPL